MGTLAKQGALNSLIIYSGFAVGYLNVGILLPLYFTPAQVGSRETLVAYALTLATIGLLGNTNVLLKYYPKYSLLKKHGLIGIFLVIGLMTSLAILGLFTLLTRSYSSISNVFIDTYALKIICCTFSFIMINMLDAYFRSIKLSHISVFLRELLIRIISTVIIIAFGMKLINFDTFINLFISSYFLIIFIYLFYLKLKTDHTIVFRLKALKTLDQKPLLKFATYSFLAGAAGIIVIQIDKVMITSLIDVSQTGIYALAVYIATLIEAPRRALLQSASPLIAKAWKEKDFRLLRSISHKSSINLQVIGSLLFLLIWCSIDEIYLIIPKESIYAKGKFVVLFIGIAKLTTMSFGLNNELISYSPKYRYNLYLSVFLAVLTISMNYLFLPKYGIEGAAIATLITFATMNIVKQVIIWVEFKFNQFSFKNIQLIIICLVIIFCTQHIPKTINTFVFLLIKSTLIASVFCLLIYVLKISEEVNATVKKYLTRKK